MTRSLPAAAGLLLAVPAMVMAAPPSAPAGDVVLPEVSGDARLQTILDRFDNAQLAIETLQADFDERKDLALLVEPIQASGAFIYANPNRARWEYSDPEARVLLIADGKILQYFPEKKLAERRELSAHRTSLVFRFFGMGQTSKELATLYRISLDPDNDQEGTYKLVLVPRRRAVGKRIARVLLWVGDRDFLPRTMTYEEADGDVTRLNFSNLRLNQDLPARAFNLDLPADVTLSRELSMFSSGGSSR